VIQNERCISLFLPLDLFLSGLLTISKSYLQTPVPNEPISIGICPVTLLLACLVELLVNIRKQTMAPTHY